MADFDPSVISSIPDYAPHPVEAQQRGLTLANHYQQNEAGKIDLANKRQDQSDEAKERALLGKADLSTFEGRTAAAEGLTKINPKRGLDFMGKVGQLVYVSATPARFEIENSVVGNTSYVAKVTDALPMARTVRISGSAEPIGKFDVTTKGRSLVVEQIIRPTGLLDPIITIKPLKGQIDETIELCRQRIEKGERVLVTTLAPGTWTFSLDTFVSAGSARAGEYLLVVVPDP